MDIDFKDILKKIKDKGINRKLDELGRIVIPKEFRKTLECDSGSKVLIEFLNDLVIIKKVNEEEENFSRKIDSLGRIVISKEFREAWFWKENDLIKISVYDSYLILRKVNRQCIFCYNEKDLFKYNNKYICNKCKQDLLKKFLIF